MRTWWREAASLAIARSLSGSRPTVKEPFTRTWRSPSCRIVAGAPAPPADAGGELRTRDAISPKRWSCEPAPRQRRGDAPPPSLDVAREPTPERVALQRAPQLRWARALRK